MAERTDELEPIEAGTDNCGCQLWHTNPTHHDRLLTLEDCDHRIAKCQETLYAGTAPPELVGQWLTDVQRERDQAVRDVAAASPRQTVDEAEVRAMVAAIGNVAAKMTRATPAVKARVYADLGLRIIYSPASDHFVVEAAPRVANACVGGGT